jgi:hypothetical protein
MGDLKQSRNIKKTAHVDSLVVLCVEFIELATLKKNICIEANTKLNLKKIL